MLLNFHKNNFFLAIGFNLGWIDPNKLANVSGLGKPRNHIGEYSFIVYSFCIMPICIWAAQPIHCQGYQVDSFCILYLV